MSGAAGIPAIHGGEEVNNTQVPLWAHNLFGSPFYIFLLRQFFLGLPRELFEAAGSTEPATSSCSARSPCP
jgi:hypothetical protein